MKSIKDVSEGLVDDHRKYIEATYHLHNPRLIEERRQLMESDEVATEPWVEASPGYTSGNNIADLDLPSEVIDILGSLNDAGLDVFDPPYTHQAEALERFFADDKDLIVSTGTGSGKTEIFLYSILGQLAREAKRGNTNTKRGVRTLVLYPMNALVADQLSRMRLMFGDDQGANILEDLMDRRVQFGMYTGRTPYHGKYDTDKNYDRLSGVFDDYIELQEQEAQTPEDGLYADLKEKGRIPAKNLKDFRNKGASRTEQFRTQPGDTELFTRQEMHEAGVEMEHGGTPDLLITNYSMLEYMLLRPIEQPLFEDTREWLDADEDNELNIVLDESHLYRGAQGAEVSLLLSRLMQKLGVDSSRVRFILTSATMGGDVEDVGPDFAADLTTTDADNFAVITGDKEEFGSGDEGSPDAAQAFYDVGYEVNRESVSRLADARGWSDIPPEDEKTIQQYLYSELPEDPVFRKAHEQLREDTLELSEIATDLFPEADDEIARDATGNLLHLSTEAEDPDDETALLPTRLHMFLKGLPTQYACVNPDCEGRRAKDPDNKILGRFYANPRDECDHCSSRVFELLSHRTCGAAYIRAYLDPNNGSGPTYLWTDPGESDDLEEVHLLVEEPREDSPGDAGGPLSVITQSRELDLETGHLLRTASDDSGSITVRIPERPDNEDHVRSFTRCPACGIEERRRNDGTTKISDLETKGEEPFANIVRSMFEFQPEQEGKDHLPNEGKKVLCFSDGRQKAARLARDLQRGVELDSFREVAAYLVDEILEDDAPVEHFFPAFAIYCEQNNVTFFDDEDESSYSSSYEYQGSRSIMQEIQERVSENLDYHDPDDPYELLHSEPVREDLGDRPKQFDTMLLRSLGDSYYSLPASLVAYLKPRDPVFADIQSKNEDVDEELLWAIVVESIRAACEEMAYDKEISTHCRNKTQQYRFKSDSEEGITGDSLVPEYVQSTLGGEISDEQWDSISESLHRTLAEKPLFERNAESKYFVNPEAVSIDLALNGDWHRCEGCRRFTNVSFHGTCPREGCSGELNPLSQDDVHLEAKKSFLRDPPKAVVNGDRDPFTLRSEEHSAQLNAKDDSDTFSKTEKYELLFQDIMVGESEAEQPIDVLSCTTTMEVGIDIGSLTGVALRTVPPRPDNYEQRAGRAGRRGVGLSTIITFADNSPHESHYFENPGEMIGADADKPIIYSGNEKIAQRHINASLLAKFFDPTEIDESADVFESLGSTIAFFEEDDEYTLVSFREFIESEVLVDDSEIVAEIGSLLPEALGEDRGDSWRIPFVRDQAETFLDDLETLRVKTDWSEEADEEDELLETLLDEALLPTFSFPINLAHFLVKGFNRDNNVETKYDITQDLTQALSTLAPGRDLVVDKKTFTSYGLSFRFAENPVNRAEQVDWDSLERLNFCSECDSMFEDNDDLAGEACPICGAEVQSIRRYTPEGFAPEYKPYSGPEEGGSYSDTRVQATAPKYPLTLASEETTGTESIDSSKSTGIGSVHKLADEELLVSNFGPDEDGFEVCQLCGAIGADGSLSDSHNRPYPKDERVYQAEDDWSSKCNGRTISTSLSHSFQSDLTVLRIPVKDPMVWRPNEPWFSAAARSFSEALVIGSSRALGIESDELEGGFRTRAPEPDADPDIKGYIECFLFDTTPGGAGFSARAWEQFDSVLDAASRVLHDCDCNSSCHNCLNTYQNRHIHDSLDRHIGGDLLTYLKTGTAPEMADSRRERLVNQLRGTLQHLNSDITIEENPDGIWTISDASGKIRFDLRSDLRGSRVDHGVIDHDFSGYQLTAQLPKTAYEITRSL